MKKELSQKIMEERNEYKIMFKLKKYIVFIIVTIFSILTFAEFSAPNILIVDNPTKQVNTVEAKKNRKNAELNITVNKINPKELEGYRISNSEYYIELPLDEKLDNDEVYFIVKSVDELPDLSNINGKKIINNLKAFENYSMKTSDFSYVYLGNIILIDKAPSNIQSFFISKLNKNSGEIKKVYEIKRLKNVEIKKLDGLETEENINFVLSEDILQEFREAADIQIGENFREIFKNLSSNSSQGKRRNRRDLEKTKDSNLTTYKINEEDRQLVIENKKDISQVRILALDQNKRISQMYVGNVVKNKRIREGRVSFDYNNPVFYGGSGTTGGFDKFTYYGRVRIFPGEAMKVLVDRNQYYVPRGNDRDRQYKIIPGENTLIPIEKTSVSKQEKVIITGYIDGTLAGSEEKTLIKVGTADKTGLIDNMYFGDQFKIMVAIPHLEDGKGGVDIGIDKWDLNYHTVKIEMFYPKSGIKNTITFTTPAYDASLFFKEIKIRDKLIFDKNTRNIKGVKRGIQKGYLFELDVLTKDYDLYFIGRTWRGISRLSFTIPKKLKLKLINSEGDSQTLEGTIELKINNNQSNTTIVEDLNYYYIGNNGGQNREDPTEVDLNIKLKIDVSQINKNGNYQLQFDKSLKQEPIVKFGDTFGVQSTVINELDYLLKYLTIKEETIDVSNSRVNDKIFSQNTYSKLLKSDYKLVLKNNGRTIFESTVNEISTEAKDISEAGISLKYDRASGKFEFTKTNGKNFDKALDLEVSSKQEEIALITLNLKNKVSFEIIDGYGKLDFGNFFPGDTQTAKNIIKFKNPAGAKVKVSLKDDKLDMVKMGISSPTINQKVRVNELKVTKLDNNISQIINSFEIQGIATTTASTESGSYKGIAEVIIEIIP